MKIIYDHQIFVRQRHGGISRYFLELKNKLSSKNAIKAEIFAPLHINAYLNLTHEHHGLCLPKFRGSTFALDVASKIAGFSLIKPKSDIDIFHQTYYAPNTYAPTNAKRVLTIFDMIHERFPQSFRNAKETTQAKQLAIRNSDHIICISENTRRDLIDILGIKKEMTSVVYLGHSLSQSVISKNRYKLPHDTPYLLYVGNRSGYKNFKNLIAAYSSSKAFRNAFALVFFGGGSFSQDELKTLQDHGLPNTLVIHIEGDDQVLSSMYVGATAFIYPSLYEGFGIPPLEAMAHGCPVLCSNTSSLPEVVGSAAELFDPYDPSSISCAIDRVLASKENLNSLVARGYKQITKFSWEKCAEETSSTYMKLINEGSV